MTFKNDYQNLNEIFDDSQLDTLTIKFIYFFNAVSMWK